MGSSNLCDCHFKVNLTITKKLKGNKVFCAPSAVLEQQVADKCYIQSSDIWQNLVLKKQK